MNWKTEKFELDAHLPKRTCNLYEKIYNRCNRTKKNEAHLPKAGIPISLLADLSEEMLAREEALDDYFDEEMEQQQEEEHADNTILGMDSDGDETDDETEDPSYVPEPHEIINEIAAGENHLNAPEKGHSMRKYMRQILGLSAHSVRHDVPDIISISGHSGLQAIAPAHRRSISITIVEFTYTAEKPEAVAETIKAKTEKYQPLIRALISLGYQEPKLVILVGGVRGWHPTSNKDLMQRSLSLSTAAQKRIFKAWTFTAWHHIRSIIGWRRSLEFQEPACERSGLVKWIKFKADAVIRKRKGSR